MTLFELSNLLFGEHTTVDIKAEGIMAGVYKANEIPIIFAHRKIFKIRANQSNVVIELEEK